MKLFLARLMIPYGKTVECILKELEEGKALHLLFH